MKRILTTFFLLSLAIFVSAQSKTITGKVTDAHDGSPIVGVTVVEKGTTNGAITDESGAYRLQVSSPNAILKVSFMGMQSVEASATRNTINVSLSSSTVDVDEVMIVAYGTSKKASFTGSATPIKGAEIAKLQTSSVSKALEGAVAGVQVNSTSGQPGDDASIRIRGVSSINASSNPLYVVDGVPFQGSINSINANDIESMTILKDAASTALYGSRGANGVIMITTKQGKTGKGTVNFSAKVGVNSRAIPTYDIMTDPGAYYQKTWEALKFQQMYSSTPMSEAAASQFATDNLISSLGGYNAYKGVPNNAVVSPDGTLTSAPYLYNDNWSDETFTSGMRQEYNLDFSGASDKTKYYLSFGRLSDEGIVKGSNFNRTTVRTNLNHVANKWLEVGTSLNYSKAIKSAPKVQKGDAYSNPFMFTQQVAPIYPVYVYDAQGNKTYDAYGDLMYDYGNGEMNGDVRPYAANQNSAAMSSLDLNETIDDNLGVRSDVKIKLTKDLVFSSNLGYDLLNRNSTVFYSPLHGDAQSVNGRSQKSFSRNETITLNQLFSYNKSFDKHNFSVLAGHESYNFQSQYLYGEKTNFFDPTNNELANGLETAELTSYRNGHSVESYLSELKYNYDDKYYFSGSFRTDGSSKFYKDNRWGNFWSLGASWRINKEDFMKDVAWIDDLKYKISYGSTGNDGILDNEGYIVYTPYQDLYKVVNIGGAPALSLYYKGNQDLTWESNRSFNTGIELSAFKSRLNFSFEYFTRVSDNMLYNNPVPLSTGIAYVPQNIGAMRNNGIEFTIGGDIIRGQGNGFKWNMSLNGTHIKNTITELPEDKKESGIVNGTKILKEGGSMYDFYLVQYAGVEESTGLPLYMMKTTNPDNTETWTTTTNYSAAANDSKVVKGSALPDFQGGVTNTFYYKGFDLSIMTNFQIGGLVYDANYANQMGSGELGTNWNNDIQNSWTPENTHTDVPRVTVGLKDVNVTSDRFLIDASYFNIRNINFGYTFNSTKLKAMGINNFRAFLTADNVAFFSRRQGLDTRQNFSGTNNSFNYSALRTISAGITVQF